MEEFNFFLGALTLDNLVERPFFACFNPTMTCLRVVASAETKTLNLELPSPPQKCLAFL